MFTLSMSFDSHSSATHSMIYMTNRIYIFMITEPTSSFL